MVEPASAFAGAVRLGVASVLPLKRANKTTRRERIVGDSVE
jgi:hypothetical protein